MKTYILLLLLSPILWTNNYATSNTINPLIVSTSCIVLTTEMASTVDQERTGFFKKLKKYIEETVLAKAEQFFYKAGLTVGIIGFAMFVTGIAGYNLDSELFVNIGLIGILIGFIGLVLLGCWGVIYLIGVFL